jgi:hypothetical protein
VTFPAQLESADSKVELAMAEKPQGLPPAYEAAGIEHGLVPKRTGLPPSGGKQMPRGPFPLDIPVLNELRGKRVILASASPRRKQILSTVSPPLPCQYAQ